MFQSNWFLFCLVLFSVIILVIKKCNQQRWMTLCFLLHTFPQFSLLSFKQVKLCVFCPAGFTSVKVFSWSVKVRGTCGCAVSVTTLCLSRAIIWTARLDELRVTRSTRFTPVPTSRYPLHLLIYSVLNSSPRHKSIFSDVIIEWYSFEL